METKEFGGVVYQVGRPRIPRKGEYFLDHDHLYLAEADYVTMVRPILTPIAIRIYSYKEE